jgi:hypothetical protein
MATTTTIYTTTGAVPVRAWPHTIKATEVAFNLRYSTSAFTSPFTRTTQTTELPGALHLLEASFPSVKASQVGELRAFFASLRGSAGRFIFSAYPCRYAPPVPYGAERITLLPLTCDDAFISCDSTLISCDATQIQMETVFTVSSCPDAETILGTLWLNGRRYPLEIGSYIAWDDSEGIRHLHLVVALEHDATTGDATLTVEPPMREQPTPATPMHVHAPGAIFMLADDGQGALRQAATVHSFSISAMQWFPAALGVAA